MTCGECKHHRGPTKFLSRHFCAASVPDWVLPIPSERLVDIPPDSDMARICDCFERKEEE